MVYEPEADEPTRNKICARYPHTHEHIPIQMDGQNKDPFEVY